MTEFVKVTCNRCGVKVADSNLKGKQLFYDIPALSEDHLCADCVLDLMSTDPTCDEVMKHIRKSGEAEPFSSQHRHDRYPFD